MGMDKIKNGLSILAANAKYYLKNKFGNFNFISGRIVLLGKEDTVGLSPLPRINRKDPKRSRLRLFELNPGIQKRIGDIDQQVDQDKYDRHKHHTSLNNWIVAG